MTSAKKLENQGPPPRHLQSSDFGLTIKKSIFWWFYIKKKKNGQELEDVPFSFFFSFLKQELSSFKINWNIVALD